MDQSFANKYYSRPEIQKALLDFAKDREIAIRFKSSFFGKRPDVIEYLSDIKEFVSNGASSFHCSEERWANPLLLGNDKLSEEERVKNRSGWDLILDLDGVDFEYAKIVGKIIIEYLNNIGVYNVTTKFSGNKGFHIGIPFEAFSSNIIGIGETRLLFPDIARKIAAYLMHELKGIISKTILEKEGNIENISKKYNIELRDLITNDSESYNFDYMKVIEIDTILISSRHLFRMPYSLNEKSGLVSVPIKNEKIIEFQREWAAPHRIKPEYHTKYMFLKYDLKYGRDGDILLSRVFENIDQVSEEELNRMKRNIKKEEKGRKGEIIFEGDFELAAFEIDEEIEYSDFPQSIKFALENKFDDGKKRALFLLLTFMHSVKWDKNHIRTSIEDWNNKQSEPLKKNYLNAQVTWFENQEKLLSPPNYDNSNYYKSIGIDEEILKEERSKFKRINVKNPLHYIYLCLQAKKKMDENKDNKKKKN